MNRPDRPHVAHKSGDLVVHDYPVWHTVWFFFYGLLPEAVCVGVLAFVFGICATTFGMWLCFECIKSECLILPTLAFTVAMSIDAFIGCFFLLNYGVLILAALIVLLFCIKKNYQVIAGISWAFIMIKPQVGLLFVFPLLFARKYKAIFSAVLTCLILTFVMSLHYRESPISLILQIPQIGAPYQNSVLLTKVLIPIFGRLGQYVLMFTIGLLCAYLCWIFRKSGSWLVRVSPVLLCFPVWTYSNGWDVVLQVLWYFLVAMKLFGRTKSRFALWWEWYAVCCCVSIMFASVWNNFCNMGILESAGRGWIYHSVSGMQFVLSLISMMVLMKEEAGSARGRVDCHSKLPQ